MHSLHAPKKSSSLGTIAASGEPPSPGIVDHEEIIALTHDVKRFSDSLARLKLLFTEGVEPEEDARVVIHEGLGEVLSVLNPVMQHYSALQSPDIFTAARSLITMIKDHDYNEKMTASHIRDFCDAIDQLALAFSSSVSEYLMGDMGPQLVMELKTRSMNSIVFDDSEDQVESSQLSPEELDAILVKLDTGLSLALQRAKVWSRYVADIITYIEKKAQLEQDYAKNLSRLANSVQNSLKKEGFLPLQSVYCTALSQDAEYAGNLQATQAVLHSHKFVEPLSIRRTEHDKVYKSVKEIWNREFRKMTDSVTNLRKAQALYLSRQQEHDRLHELALKADVEKQEKRRKAEEEAMHKAAEAETTYKACVAEANYRQVELFKVKGELLARIREQIQLCDQEIKEVTIEYFQLYHTIISPLPLQYQTLSESSKNYLPGSQYAEFVRRQTGTNVLCQPEVFTFEPYVQGQKSSSDDARKESVHSNGSASDNHSPEGSPSPRRDNYRIPVKAWGQQIVSITSDTDSASCSSKSHESSPTGSPHRNTRYPLVSSQSLDELTEEEIAAAASAHTGQGKRGLRAKQTMTLSEDTRVLHGLLLQHAGRRNTTFGVDFQEQVDNFHTKVPPIVSKCLAEIENRGVMIKGIYRVSGVKSKVEHLCQRFDIDPESVDLEDVHPNIISNVLKLYLRQLPEPLLTFRLYSEFIHIAKENMSGQLLGEKLIDLMKKLVAKLPSSNFRTSAVLMHHLQRVAAHAEVNQMSASNLGIVFGPTLLRPLEGSASLASLVDTPHQTRAIELLITHVHMIFGPSEDFQIAPSQTPVELLNLALSGIFVPGSGLIKSQQAQAPAKFSDVIAESDDLSSSVFESCSSTQGASTSHPSSCDFVLPGTASQDRNEIQSLAIHVLDLDGSLSRSDVDDDEDFLDLLLPDQSKPNFDPLSVALNSHCIQGSGSDTLHTIRAGTTPLTTTITALSSSSPQPASIPAKPTVTKSASSPVVSRATKAQLSTSLSVPRMGSESEMVAALSSSTAGMAAGLLMSSVSFISSEKSSSSSTGPISAESSGRGELSLAPRSPVTVQETSTVTTVKQSDEGAPSPGSEKTGSEELNRKRAHSQQLQNIKFLTKAPSFDEPGSDFYPKATFCLAISGSATGPGQGAVVGPKLSTFTEKDTAPPAVSEEKDIVPIIGLPKTQEACEKKEIEPITGLPKMQEVSKTAPAELAVKPSAPDSAQSLTRASPSLSKGAPVRRSILEEVPIPTLNKSDGGGGEDGGIPSVTIPASPTIKRREIPSKIPTSPTSQRSIDMKHGEEKTDNRADRFRQEQRKLVRAIKSDAKIGTVVTSSEAVMVHMSSSAPVDSDADLLSKDPKRYSDVFDDVFSGGCALSVSSRSNSQSEETQLGNEAQSKDRESRSRENSASGLDREVQSASSDIPEAGQSGGQLFGQAMGTPVRSLRAGTWMGKSDTPKLGIQGSPRQRPASMIGESSSPKPVAAAGKSRLINMPSTSSVKKTALTSLSLGTKTTVSQSLSKAPATTSPPLARITPSPSSSYAATKSNLPGRTAVTKPAPSLGFLSSGTAAKHSLVSSDQGSQICSRAAASMSKSFDETYNLSKSSSPVLRKSRGKGGDLGLSRSSRSSGSSSPKVDSPPTPVESTSEKSSPPSSQSSSPQHRHPSGEASSSPTGRSLKQVQRKLPTSSGSPRKVHERCQQERPGSTATKSGGQQGSSTPKIASVRPSQLPPSPAISSASSSPATTPTSGSSKLSHDRTPRFV